MKLSRREKILLFLAGLTALVSVGLTKIVLPAMGEYMVQRELYEAAVAEEDLWLREREALGGDAGDQGALWQEEYNVCRELFPDRMENEEAERLVLSCLEEDGLQPVSSRILSNGSVNLDSGSWRAKGFAASFQVQAEGEMENFVSFQEDLEEELCMRLVSFQAVPDAGNSWRFTVELECYMLEGGREEE